MAPKKSDCSNQRRRGPPAYVVVEEYNCSDPNISPSGFQFSNATLRQQSHRGTPFSHERFPLIRRFHLIQVPRLTLKQIYYMCDGNCVSFLLFRYSASFCFLFCPQLLISVKFHYRGFIRAYSATFCETALSLAFSVVRNRGTRFPV